MTRSLLTGTALLALTAFAAQPASASSSYEKSRNACTAAIQQQVGSDDVRFDLDKIRSRARFRDYRFIVRTADDQRLRAECRAKDTGEILALTINGSERMVAGG